MKNMLLQSDLVLQFGAQLTSKRLDDFLNAYREAGSGEYVRIAPYAGRYDSSHNVSQYFTCSDVTGLGKHFQEKPPTLLPARKSTNRMFEVVNS